MNININACDDSRETPLLLAVRLGFEVSVRLLLKRKDVDMQARGYCARTPLILAATLGHEHIVRLLLEHKDIDTSARDDWGWTALLTAALYGRDAIVKLLIEQSSVVGADIMHGVKLHKKHARRALFKYSLISSSDIAANRAEWRDGSED